MCTSDKFGCLNKLSPVEEGEPPYMIAGDFRGGIILSLYWMPFILIPRHYLPPIFLLLAKMFLHTSAALEGTEHCYSLVSLHACMHVVYCRIIFCPDDIMHF